jgi:hypothetical protein
MRSRLSLLLLVPVFAAAGCSSTPRTDGADRTEPTTADTTADTVDPAPAAPTCANVSAAVIKATLNLAVSEPTQAVSGTTTTCEYGALNVTIKFTTGADKDSFARERRSLDNGGQPTSDVSGLLDEAYVSSTESGDTVTNSLVARKGSITMSVAAVAPVDAEKSLVAKVLGGTG